MWKLEKMNFQISEVSLTDNYTITHCHTELSLLDSTTNYKEYIDKASECGMKSICFTEHGNIYNWIEKKMYCEAYKVKTKNKTMQFHNEKDMNDFISKQGSDFIYEVYSPIKYLHGCEVYLTESLSDKIRDNYHTILIARNLNGVKELNYLIDLSTYEDHTYYKPRITFDEFLNISDNIIKISACLQSPLNKLLNRIDDLQKEIDSLDDGLKDYDSLVENNKRLIKRAKDYHELLLKAYHYYEIQPHVNSDEQIQYNKYLYKMSKEYNIPLICGTDTHSINKYKAECRTMLQYSKDIIFENEDLFDLSFKTYNEVVNMFKMQDSLPEDVYLNAIENTNKLAESIEEFVLDVSFKYPKIDGDEELLFKNRVNQMYKEKIIKGIITDDKVYLDNIKEEFRVLKKIGMLSFIYFMSELACWCHENDIPTGFCRGSVGGSYIAYILDIIDVNPYIWGTKFSRFANEDRIEIGDIDMDFAPEDRERVYEYIINRFGNDKTAFILTTNTLADKGVIDEVVRGFANKYRKDNGLKKKDPTPYTVEFAKEIKSEFETNPEKARKKYATILYYFDGMRGCVVSKGIHPAGIVASPVTLPDNYGTFWYEGKRVMSINMEEIHEVSLVKYDILGLNNIGIIKQACKIIGIKYPLSHEINWCDDKVWDDMITSNVGVFQFESDYAFGLLKQFKPHKVNDMSLVNACLRPSGESYRDNLLARIPNINPSEIIDDLLKDNGGYLVFEEDVTRFLQDICGLSGSKADNVRRAIGRKQMERLQEALPDILEGYCEKSSKPREIAEEEAKVFLKIIEDASSYMFGYNHSTGYSMIGYLCALLRCYYPSEFIAAYLNCVEKEEDIMQGTKLAEVKNIKIKPIKFRHSRGKYFVSKDEKDYIYKGVSSIKYMNEKIADELYTLRENKYNSFIELLNDIIKFTTTDSRQLEILIKLDFFEEFGSINYLLKCVEIYNMFKDKSQFKKDKAFELNIDFDILRKCSGKETEKTFMQLDSDKIINLLVAEINNDPVSIKNKIQFQSELLGYIDIVDKKYSGLCVVTNINVDYSPKISLYALANGNTIPVKIDKITFSKKPLKRGDIVKVERQYKKKKMKKVDNDWIETDEKEWWITEYKVV
jgi:DNA polymerase-3 subunit alpha